MARYTIYSDGNSVFDTPKSALGTPNLAGALGAGNHQPFFVAPCATFASQQQSADFAWSHVVVTFLSSARAGLLFFASLRHHYPVGRRDDGTAPWRSLIAVLTSVASWAVEAAENSNAKNELDRKADDNSKNILIPRDVVVCGVDKKTGACMSWFMRKIDSIEFKKPDVAESPEVNIDLKFKNAVNKVKPNKVKSKR